MRAGIARSAIITAMAAPLAVLAAPSASADPSTVSNAAQPAATSPDQPALSNIDAPYISITICLHIPTPGSATLDWCWPG